MNYDGKSDREVLLLVADRTERLEAAVVGKNRPGLIENVAALQQEVDDLKEAGPGPKERWGVIGGVVIAVVSIGAKMLGVPLPL